ncbi:hypothetical protein HDF16_005556 [Granulicella aggregans]|uniref:Uncharacterized protein n=1 Tax=Granulicella aggregans TaxID=474949 RepID=A0A7W7ZJ20_9BACT|nr:hypothetical protein [Granulicella aggregans]MBB5060820.1 hypothetical protein [Granulicella aggregans]
MTDKPISSDWNNFKEFVRKVVTVPKEEIDKIKAEEEEELKAAPKKHSTKVKPKP